MEGKMCILSPIVPKSLNLLTLCSKKMAGKMIQMEAIRMMLLEEIGGKLLTVSKPRTLSDVLYPSPAFRPSPKLFSSIQGYRAVI
ncbi:hypothetical protein F8388_005557 [Cannabis sativa]|uniref:Uncharacterized protein n=1 Tax=Cannabis sativa TaxID=3483 RepID=A0A7J6H014_CANSA|nr:hypothetical protein F8388_005557 [Cannabis sativa]